VMGTTHGRVLHMATYLGFEPEHASQLIFTVFVMMVFGGPASSLPDPATELMSTSAWSRQDELRRRIFRRSSKTRAGSRVRTRTWRLLTAIAIKHVLQSK
jgi:hypothetical protein